ncbi:hypothetical protein C8J56DRAFT_954109 [Mycena floridula]|nr:hypothetical protein C8J56DRAFT_954109 [Mycena floridula]
MMRSKFYHTLTTSPSPPSTEKDTLFSSLLVKSPKEFAQENRLAYEEADSFCLAVEGDIYRHTLLPPPNSVHVWFINSEHKLSRLVDPDLQGLFTLDSAGNLWFDQILRTWGLENCSVFCLQPNSELAATERLVSHKAIERAVQNRKQGTWKECLSSRNQDFISASDREAIQWFNGADKLNDGKLAPRGERRRNPRPILLLERPISRETARRRARREIYLTCLSFLAVLRHLVTEGSSDFFYTFTPIPFLYTTARDSWVPWGHHQLWIPAKHKLAALQQNDKIAALLRVSASARRQSSFYLRSGQKRWMEFVENGTIILRNVRSQVQDWDWSRDRIGQSLFTLGMFCLLAFGVISACVGA